MLIFESFLPALSLSLDAFAVAICIGLGICETEANRKAAFRMGIACGGFQFFMPFLGWFLGAYFLDYISSFDHWVAFALLSLVGGNMIRSSLLSFQTCDISDPTRLSALFYLALATSLDALAVGTSLSIVSKPVVWLATLAGIITATLCFIGVQSGRALGIKFGKRVELIGGTILILIGLNILREHLF